LHVTPRELLTYVVCAFRKKAHPLRALVPSLRLGERLGRQAPPLRTTPPAALPVARADSSSRTGGETGPPRAPLHRGRAVGAGVRRVEAVAGSAAQQYVSERLQVLDRIATRLNSVPEEVESRVEALLAEQRALQKEIERLQRRLARAQFEEMLGRIQQVDGANLLVAQVDVAGVDELREMADWFRDKVSSGVAVFGTIHNDKPMLIATVTEDLIQRGVKAGD